MDIFQKFNMKINESKCVTFNTKIKSIPKRKTFKYLGVHFHQDGRMWNGATMERELKEKTQNLKNLGYANPNKAHRIWTAIVDSKLNSVRKRFCQDETDTTQEYLDRLRRVLRKQLFGLPKSLKNELYLAFERRCFTKDMTMDNEIPILSLNISDALCSRPKKVRRWK